jgi:hypothetical protein
MWKCHSRAKGRVSISSRGSIPAVGVGILVDVHPVPSSEKLKSRHLQLPRSGPDEQPIESSQLASIWPGGLDGLDRVLRGNLVPAVAAFENVIWQQVHGVAALGAKRCLVDNDPCDLFDLRSRFAPPPRARSTPRLRHRPYQTVVHLLPDRWCSSWAFRVFPSATACCDIQHKSGHLPRTPLRRRKPF